MSHSEEKWGRRWGWMALTLLLLAAWGLRMRGIEWPLLHPDEYKITDWSLWIESHTRTLKASYPGGFFHLVKPILLVKNTLLDSMTAWQSFLGHGDTALRSGLEETFLLRKINVGFSLLTILVFYGIAFRATRSRVASLASTAFLGLSALHIEHSHFAETDIAMLLTLTVALYAWVRVCEDRKLLWIWAAAFLTGLAIGTKYTNLLLVPVGIAGIVRGFRVNPGREKGGRVLVLMVLGSMVLLMAGLYYANRHILDGATYWKSLKAGSEAVCAEREGLLGQAVNDPRAGVVSNWNVIRDVGAGMSPFWLALMALGAGGSLHPRYRWCWPVTWLPLLLSLGYCLKVAPWIRGQEVLMFFPVLAVFIAMGVAEGMRWAMRLRWRKMALAGVAAAVVAACFESGLSALRISSLFAHPEARIQATKWLYEHAPLNKRVGIEDYTIPACRLFESFSAVGQVERLSPAQYRKENLAYLLRNVTSTGRGMEDPRTRRLYPDYARNGDGFKQQARRLCHWGVTGLPFSFVGNEIEWWDTVPTTSAMKLEAAMFRPVLVDPHPCVPVTLSECGVGSGTALMIGPLWRQLLVGGTVGERRTLFVILQTGRYAAEIQVNAMGARHSVQLNPYDVAIVPVKRPWYLPRISEYDVISVKSRGSDHFQDLSCEARVALSEAEVAMILFQKGYPDRVSPWLVKAGNTGAVDWVRYACAVEEEDWDLANRLEPSARRCLEGFEAASVISPDQLVLNGCSGVAWRDHSRLRLPEPDTGWNGVEFRVPPRVIDLKRDDGGKVFSDGLAIPVLLPPGRYTVRAEFKALSFSGMEGPWNLTLGDSVGKAVLPVVLHSGKPLEIVHRFTVNREEGLMIPFTSLQRGGRLEVSNLEIQWNENTVLWAERRELYRALIQHAGQRGALEAARDLVAKARASIGDEEDWGRFAQLRHSSGKAGKGIFYPWMKLVGVDAVEPSRIRVQFEVLKDRPPALKVRAFRKALGGPRKFFETPLAARVLMRGDTVTLEIPLPPKTEVSDISLRMVVDGEWSFGQLGVAGSPDGRLWLGR